MHLFLIKEIRDLCNVPDKHKPVLFKIEVVNFLAPIANLDHVIGKGTVPVFDPAPQGPGQADGFHTRVDGIANWGADMIRHHPGLHP